MMTEVSCKQSRSQFFMHVHIYAECCCRCFCYFLLLFVIVCRKAKFVAGSLNLAPVLFVFSLTRSLIDGIRWQYSDAFTALICLNRL